MLDGNVLKRSCQIRLVFVQEFQHGFHASIFRQLFRGSPYVRFESGVTEIAVLSFLQRNREWNRRCVALFRQSFQRRSAASTDGKSQQTCRFVVTLPERVVECPSDNSIATDAQTLEQLTVTPRNQQSQERKFHFLLVFDPSHQNVRLEVMNTHERFVVVGRDLASFLATDPEAELQTRSDGHTNRINILQRCLCLAQGLFDDPVDVFFVGRLGKPGHHPAPFLVDVSLRCQ
mmetsp:Transcript_23855/g.56196  ORF Transcript_23855/g.56196 Transcript_23855/m.56196 type:complete len:232 (+) Transcript_23855:324-1019(+)